MHKETYDNLNARIRDYDLVREYLHGSETAAKILYNESYNSAFYHAKRCNYYGLLCDDDFVEIVNEAFRRCLNKCDLYKSSNRFATWLNGFVRYVALEINRRKCIHYKRSVPINEKLSIIEDPEYHYILKEQYRALWIAFYSLSALHRQIIQYSILDDSTIYKTARNLKMKKDDVIEEYEIAITVLRRRYFKAYYL